MKKETSVWWRDFFPTFRPVFDSIPAKITNDQVRYIIKKLNLKPGSSFLDCACGIGRIALPIAKMGIKVTGVDITASYLEEFEKKAKERGLKIKLIQSDMRRVNFKDEFDAAANLWTSIGYFDSDSDDLLILKKMHQALKPGGKFMLHLGNRDFILHHFQSNDWLNAGKVKIFEHREFDYRSSKITSTWHFIKDGVETTHKVDLRMYSYHELVRMFESAGFIEIEGYGTTKDAPITRDTLFMFIIGTKPRK